MREGEGEGSQREQTLGGGFPGFLPRGLSGDQWDEARVRWLEEGGGGQTWSRSMPEVCVSMPFSSTILAEMCSGSKEGSYLRLMDVCITQL